MTKVTLFFYIKKLFINFFIYLCIMYQDIKREILAELRRDTNGAVVGTMFEMLGSETYVNYGVTIPHIKKIAREYAPNHTLAQEIFISDIREMKLCAIYIDTPNDVTVQQMELWSEAFRSVEIMEHCASMLFYGAPDALSVALGWMKKYPYAALLMAAKRAKTMFKKEEYDTYQRILSYALLLPDSGIVFGAKCKFLVALANNNDQMKEYILNLSLSERVLEEINWQIEQICDND